MILHSTKCLFRWRRNFLLGLALVTTFSAFAEEQKPGAQVEQKPVIREEEAPAKPVEAKPAEKAELSVQIVHLGKLDFGALFQGWLVSDSTNTVNTVRLRRTELRFSGSLLEKTRWFLMFDFSKSPQFSTAGTLSSTRDNKILQDWGLGYAFAEGWEFVIGQFKTRTTAEGLDPSAELISPERSSVARIYGDRRQEGIMVTKKEKLWAAAVMVANGGSTNTEDTDIAKDLSVRGDVAPLPGVAAGAFLSSPQFDIGGNRAIGFNARWKGESETLRAEFVQGKSSTGSVSTYSRGYILDAAYRFFPKTEGVLRYENYNPNTDNPLISSAVTFGANYYLLANNIKFQGSYLLLYNMVGGNGTYTPSTTEIGRGRLLIVSFQMAI